MLSRDLKIRLDTKLKQSLKYYNILLMKIEYSSFFNNHFICRNIGLIFETGYFLDIFYNMVYLRGMGEWLVQNL